MTTARTAVLRVLCYSVVIASCSQRNTTSPPATVALPTPTALATITPILATPTSSAQAISPSNAAQTYRIGRIGNGIADHLNWSADGLKLAVSSTTGVFVYDAVDRSLIRAFPSEKRVMAMALSSDGSNVAAAFCVSDLHTLGVCSESDVLLLDVSEGSIEGRLSYSPGSPNALAFSPDGHTLAGAGCGNRAHVYEQCIEGKITLWDLVTYEPIRELVGHSGEILDLEFSPHGTMLVSGGADGIVQLWRTNGDKSWFFMTRCEAPIDDVAFSPDGTTVAAGTCNEALVWNVESGKLAARSPFFDGKVTSVDYAPEGHLLAIGGDWQDPRVILWEPGSELPTYVSQPHSFGVSSMVFNPDGGILAYISRNSGVVFISGTDGEALDTVEGSWGYFPVMAFSPDGNKVAVVSMNGTVEEWDPRSATRVATLAVVEGHVYSIAYRTTGDIVLLACVAGELRYVDGTTGLVLLRSTYESKECYSIDHVTLNHAGTFAGVRQNQNWGIRVWNLLDNTWDSHTDHSFATQDIVFANDDQYVAALSMYGVVFLWDMKGNEILRTNSDPEGYYDLGNNYCLAISNDSELFAEAGAEIHVGPLREESEPRRLSIPVDNYPTARAIAISQNADLIALGVDSDEISTLLLDIKRGSLLATLNGHTNFIIRIWFSPDGSILADASSDGTILLWGIE